jgi:quercetin dioxygenase-like cupin family protein
MGYEVLHRRSNVVVRRQWLAPGERTPWHTDPCHRVTVVLRGDELAIEFRDDDAAERLAVHPGEVDWDEPTERVHRAVNVGREPFEEIVIFLLDAPGADPQPEEC